MSEIAMMDDDEVRRIYDEHQRLVETHCWRGRDPGRPWMPSKIVRSELVDRYQYEMLTEAQIDWLIDNFTGRGVIGEMMLDLLCISRHPKAEEWAQGPEGSAIMDDEMLRWDLLGGYPEPKA
jgi:hypothetical protein